MERRAAGVLQGLAQLLSSSLPDQLRTGDSLGLWTFNEEVQARQFPLRKWSPASHNAIARSILSFISEQPYEKEGSLDTAMVGISNLVQRSEFLTVILVSDGAQEMRGTPFDKAINDSYHKWESDQKRARMPFITILRAEKGTITHFTVSPVPWPVEMPPLPAALQARESPKSVQPKPEPRKLPPLIVAGKKPAPVVSTSTNAAEKSPPDLSAAQATSGTSVAGAATSSPKAPNTLPTTVTSTPPETQPTPRAADLTSPLSTVPASEPIPPTPAPDAALKPSAAATTTATSAVPAASTPDLPAPAIATAPGGWLTPRRLLLAGMLLAVLGFGGLLIWVRRPRARQPVSLITKSIDRLDQP